MRRAQRHIRIIYIIFIMIINYSDLLAEARRYNDDLYKMYENISNKKKDKGSE